MFAFFELAQLFTKEIALYHRRHSGGVDSPSNLLPSMHGSDGRLDDIGNYNGRYTAVNNIGIAASRDPDSRGENDCIRYFMSVV